MQQGRSNKRPPVRPWALAVLVCGAVAYGCWCASSWGAALQPTRSPAPASHVPAALPVPRASALVTQESTPPAPASPNAPASTDFETWLPESMVAVARADLALWANTTLRVADVRNAALRTPGAALFRVDRSGVVTHEGGRREDWHFNCFVQALLPEAAKAAATDPAATFPLWLLLHAWDEPIGRMNEPECEARYGQLHGNLWNKHVASPPRVPFFVNGKIRGCHSDVLIPQEKLCEAPSPFWSRTPTAWEARSNMTFWRGSATGFGTLVRRRQLRSSSISSRRLLVVNHRLRWVRHLQQWPDLFDAGLTEFPGTDRTVVAPGLPLSDWARYKYILNLGGNSYSGRVGVLATLNSTLLEAGLHEDLLLASLVNGTHMLRAAPDGSDIERMVRWLRRHDSVGRALGEALYAHHAAYFTRAGLVEYTRILLLLYGQAVRFVD